MILSVSTRSRIGVIGFLGALPAPLAYSPDLGPVGSGSAYFPRDVSGDANALNFLGFLDDASFAGLTPSLGNQSDDMNQQAGGFDPAFRAAVVRFQDAGGLKVDSWIGPATRQGLANAVSAKNAATPPGTPPDLVLALPPTSIAFDPGTVPTTGADLPGVAKASSKALLFGGIGLGVLVLGGLTWWALR